MISAISVSLVLSFFSYQAKAATPGFSQGDQFFASSLQGTITVSCNGSESATYSCYGTVLEPSNYDYFVGIEGVTANQVSLINTRADGSRRDRSESYNPQTKKSGSAFNLWVSTPFQRPLLALGKNKIDYFLTSAGKIVHQGVFTVNVTQGPSRVCPATYYNSMDENDCRSQYTTCQKYFTQYDNCR